MKIREEKIDLLEQEGKFQDAAIIAFVLAIRAQKTGDKGKAMRFKRKCLELLEKYPTDTLEQCASPYIALADVFITGIFHEGKERREFDELNL